MKYIISYDQPQQHLIDITFIIESVDSDELLLQLPSWRPGRYELANFSKNIQKWNVFDDNNNALKFKKTSKDTWVVQTKGVKEVHVKYNYYGAELNAGSSFLDEKQLYINPVNCCLFVPHRMQEECSIELQLPDDYVVATGMKKTSKHKLHAKNYDELADSPLIASNSLKHDSFVLDGVEFNIWMQGECKPKWSKIINDFFVFINEQFLLMREFPHNEYHFLYQILPFKIHHGVEHVTSTVIALGPSYKLMKDELYNDFLGVSSHELFHVWNVKTIRPIEMMPYDYTKENYSRLGYVTEGVTSYYGDFLLFRSGVFSEFDYFKTIFERLQNHFDNFGRLNLSVADSSYDTWLDGYNPGIPNRKSSIYTEGCLLAFMTDILIRKHTKNEKSLDDVMRTLYVDFAKMGKGYSERDYKGIIEHIANASFDDFFNDYVNGIKSYEPLLHETLNYIGCDLLSSRSRKYYEAFYGFKIAENSSTVKISSIFPGSIADLAKLHIHDEIIAINDIHLKNDLLDWSRYFFGETVELTVISDGFLRKIVLTPTKQEYYRTYYINKIVQPTDDQVKAFNAWSKRNF